MLFENSIVGPIHSRRLGHSLGVNLLPLKHKRCSYDCVYCECGWNRDSEEGEIAFATPQQIEELLETRLKELQAEGRPVDSFTFAGNGEPTLYPQFPHVVDAVRRLRDKYYPEAAVTLLTNATQLKRPEIFEAVRKLDKPILKLDAGTEQMWQWINRNDPETGCTFKELTDNLVRFGKEGIIQTLLFDGKNEGRTISNLIPSEFNEYVSILKKIRPKYVMLYALDRATPEKELRKLSVDELNLYAEIIRKENIAVEVYG
ncbi:MAG: radical SAM protein [Bacteroidales bacterium]|nr:radical SAM protein [Bacteroidales bacterium]